MNLTEKKSEILLALSAEPQRQAKASQAIANIEAGIAELASLGLSYAAVEAQTSHTPASPQEFPKMLTRSGDYPNELVVNDENEESDARKDGYVFAGDAKPTIQPAVNSVPDADPVPAKAPTPAMTDKQVLDARMAAGSGTSTPNISTDDATKKTT